MGTIPQAPQPHIVKYKLDLHFGSNILPTQHESLVYIIATILEKKPQTIKSLVAAFLDPEYVPTPLTLEPEEAKLFLQEGTRNGLFTYDRRTGLNDLTTEYRTVLIQRQNAYETLIDEIQQCFYAQLGTDPYVPQAQRPQFWRWLREYVHRIALDYIQNAAEQEPGTNAVHVLERLVHEIPGHSSKPIVLDWAVAHYPPFIQHTAHGKRLFELSFNHTMYALRTSISRSGEHQMAEELSRYHLILDTNVLISLMGLRQNDAFTTGMRRALKALVDQGVTVSYTSATMEELRFALKAAVDAVERDNAVYAKTGEDGREYVASTSIEAAYYAQRLHYPKEEFINRYTNLEQRLEADLGHEVNYIHLSADERHDLCGTADYDACYDSILQFEPSPEKAHHDALHLALVMRRRRENPGDAVWFVTQHNALTNLKNSPGVSPPATRLDWLFILVRQFVPRVEHFPEFLNGLVSSNLFSAFDPSTDELELRRLYIKNASERAPGEVTRTTFLSAKPFVFREIAKRFGLDEADKAFEELKTYSEEVEAASEEGRKEDEEQAQRTEELEQAEQEKRQIHRRREHMERYEQSALRRSAIERRKKDIQRRQIRTNVFLGLLATAWSLVSLYTPFLDALPAWAKYTVLAIPVIITGVIIRMLDAKIAQQRLALREELDRLEEQLEEMRRNVP